MGHWRRNVINDLTQWWTLHTTALISQTKMCPLVQLWNEHYQSLSDRTLRLITQEGTHVFHYTLGQKPVTREVIDSSGRKTFLLFHQRDTSNYILNVYVLLLWISTILKVLSKKLLFASNGG